MTRYDTIGKSYAATRRTDPHIAAPIHRALAGARRVLNVGAGTGNYEPPGGDVVALDPSVTMLRQRPPGAAPALCAVAEALPFADCSFDAVLAVLTVHHWTDRDLGLRELQRVAPRQVVFFFEPSFSGRFWLVAEYFPEILALGSERSAPDTELLGGVLGGEIATVPVPADCVDGFAGCFWNRPEAYLEPEVWAGMSSLSQLDPAVRAAGVARLRADLESGAWDARHGSLRGLDEIDLGYRLLIAGELPLP